MAVFTGTGGNDTITPSVVSAGVVRVPLGSFPGPDADIIDGGAGNDLIDGAGGDDVLTGGAGNDTVNGGDGNDIINGYDTAGEVVDGGLGTDRLVITVATDAAALSNAATTDAKIVSVEVIDASAAGAALTGANALNLSVQTEGFTIIGAASFSNDITGGKGNNSISGSPNNADTITGLAGNDTIIGFSAGDIVDGGAGTDTLKIINPADGAAITGAANANIVNIEIIDASGATAGLIGANALNLAANQTEKFTVVGSAFADNIKLNNAAGNKVNGGNGDDSITGGTGADFIEGGDGKDTITGGGGSDTIDGGAGDDLIIGFVTGSSVNGGAGTDVLKISTAAEANALGTVGDSFIQQIEVIDGSSATVGLSITLTDQTEAFTIIGSAQADTIKAGAGDDVIVGFQGADTVDGGGGTANSIFLAATSTDLNSATDAQIKNIQVIGASTAVAGVKIDLQNQTEGFVIVGSAQADTLTGGSGNDFFFGFKGADNVDGKGGQNAIVLDATAPDLNSATDAQVQNVQVVYAATATAGVTIDLKNQTENITVQGSDFNDVITGTTAGDKYLAGGKGADTIDGGKGDDTILGEAGDDSLFGGDGNDSIFGGDGKDIIFGGDGKDIIFGEAGDDVLVAGFTQDTLVGGAGNDRFAFATSSLFNPGTAKVDVIADLAAGDFIVLSKTTFTAFTASSGDVISGGTAIAAADFATITSGGATAAGASSALIVYETSTGALYYNQDRATAGLGTGGQFASIAGAPALTASQILIVG